MSKHDDGLSFIVIPNAGGEPRGISLSRRRIRVLGVVGTVLGVAIAGMAVSWVSMASRAAEADDLAHKVDSLEAYHSRLDDIAQRLVAMELREDTYKRMLGLGGEADSAFWVPRPGGSARGSETLSDGEADTEPTAWPLTVAGAVTQSHFGGASADHPGIDIAVPSGSYVRAAGGGVVVEATEDSVYGLFVLIDHGNGLRTLYGHAQYLVPQRGWTVRRGEVIALSGSTGASTAPHLHFEILKDGRPVDPFSMVTPP